MVQITMRANVRTLFPGNTLIIAEGTNPTRACKLKGGNKNVQRLNEQTNNQGMVATSGKRQKQKTKLKTQPRESSGKGITAMMNKAETKHSNETLLET